MNNIIDPNTHKSYSIFSKKGKALLKNFIKSYQSGGMKWLKAAGLGALAATAAATGTRVGEEVEERDIAPINHGDNVTAVPVPLFSDNNTHLPLPDIYTNNTVNFTVGENNPVVVADGIAEPVDEKGNREVDGDEEEPEETTNKFQRTEGLLYAALGNGAGAMLFPVLGEFLRNNSMPTEEIQPQRLPLKLVEFCLTHFNKSGEIQDECNKIFDTNNISLQEVGENPQHFLNLYKKYLGEFILNDISIDDMAGILNMTVHANNTNNTNNTNTNDVYNQFIIAAGGVLTAGLTYGKQPGAAGSKPDGDGSKPGAAGSKPDGDGSKPGAAGSKPDNGSKPDGDGSKPGAAGSIEDKNMLDDILKQYKEIQDNFYKDIYETIVSNTDRISQTYLETKNGCFEKKFNDLRGNRYLRLTKKLPGEETTLKELDRKKYLPWMAILLTTTVSGATWSGFIGESVMKVGINALIGLMIVFLSLTRKDLWIKIIGLMVAVVVLTSALAGLKDITEVYSYVDPDGDGDVILNVSLVSEGLSDHFRETILDPVLDGLDGVKNTTSTYLFTSFEDANKTATDAITEYNTLVGELDALPEDRRTEIETKKQKNKKRIGVISGNGFFSPNAAEKNERGALEAENLKLDEELTKLNELESKIKEADADAKKKQSFANTIKTINQLRDGLPVAVAAVAGGVGVKAINKYIQNKNRTNLKKIYKTEVDQAGEMLEFNQFSYESIARHLKKLPQPPPIVIDVPNTKDFSKLKKDTSITINKPIELDGKFVMNLPQVMKMKPLLTHYILENNALWILNETKKSVGLRKMNKKVIELQAATHTQVEHEANLDPREETQIKNITKNITKNIQENWEQVSENDIVLFTNDYKTKNKEIPEDLYDNIINILDSDKVTDETKLKIYRGHNNLHKEAQKRAREARKAREAAREAIEAARKARKAARKAAREAARKAREAGTGSSSDSVSDSDLEAGSLFTYTSKNTGKIGLGDTKFVQSGGLDWPQLGLSLIHI